MTQRANHYEAAFEAYLRRQRRPYVAVDESRRALMSDSSLKSLDFVVYSQAQANLLVDVKGRRFPTAGAAASGHRWENWATEEDIHSLMCWERLFGAGFRSVLVFAYDLQDEQDWERHTGVWEFRQRRYAFYGVWTDEYAGVMTRRSAKWETVSLPLREFRKIRRPFDELL